MTFEGHNIIVIKPMDLSSAPHYTEPISVEDEAREIDDFYKMAATQDDYINPTADGMLSWHYDSSCTSDSKEGLENWQSRMYELLGRRCAQLTRALHWIGAKVCEIPTFDGLSKI